MLRFHTYLNYLTEMLYTYFEEYKTKSLILGKESSDRMSEQIRGQQPILNKLNNVILLSYNRQLSLIKLRLN